MGDRRATELAAWHMQTHSTPNDPRVVAAYRQLADQTDRLFQSLTDGASPYRINVGFTFLRRPYESDRELIASNCQ